MRRDARLVRLEDVERDEEARQLAEEAGMPVDEVRRQLDLWDRLLVVHGLTVGETAGLDDIRAFLTDFAVRLGDEDPDGYVTETLAEWAEADARAGVDGDDR